MMRPFAIVALLVCFASTGCATMKQTDTARTGLEQLLVSSAADRALSKVDLRPIAGAKVYIDEKFLDCVDKNYVLVALHQRLLQNNCTLAAKAEEADVVVEVASGGVGTDRTDLFLGIPEIPLAPPSPIMIPKMALFERVRSMGTAKLSVVAYDAKSRSPLINEYSLARSDHKNWNVLGFGATNSGSVYDELKTATGESDTIVPSPQELIGRRHMMPKSPGNTTAAMPPGAPPVPLR